jgi:hypothetical protein
VEALSSGNVVVMGVMERPIDARPRSTLPFL